jgi:hypothetical protein
MTLAQLLEPQAVDEMGTERPETLLASIAVSLKRIADMLGEMEFRDEQRFSEERR